MQIFTQFGKDLKKFFAPSKTSKNIAKVETEKSAAVVETKTDAETTSHGVSFGVVYANDLARAEIEKDAPHFTAGSIIVREKLLKADDATPETVIAMVKRDANFSPQTGDWEFFTFSGNDLKMKTRETQSSCAACHAQAKETDFVFRDYLK